MGCAATVDIVGGCMCAYACGRVMESCFRVPQVGGG